jgi:DNA-binding HxlR family transcriptional regulator
VVAESPEHHTPVAERCARGDDALVRAFSVLGKRWSGLVIGNLLGGPLGFRELSRAIGGVSDSVLSDRLTQLCEQGLVTRRVEPGPPISVTYELTEAGAGLMPALEEIAVWADKFLPDQP